MICPNCGKEIDDISKFCNLCGYKIGEQKPAENPNEVESTENSIEPETTTPVASTTRNRKNLVMLISAIILGIGILGFFLIVVIGLTIYGKVYFYDGYKSTGVLCTVDIVLMLTGAVGALVGLIISKKYFAAKALKILSVAVAAVGVVCAVILIVNGVKNANKKSSYNSSSYSSSSSYGQSSSSYEMDHTTYCILYLKVSDVKIKRDGDWVYCTGSVKNTGSYSIKYVKVRAGFKDSRGNVIDSDWTYAVDSDWLNPGESKNFEMMIKDENRKIKDADVIIIYD